MAGVLDGSCPPDHFFRAGIREFDQTVRDIVENLNGESKIVEAAKLRAIGQRNLVQYELEMRQRRTKELHDLLEDKNAEVARIHAECESLSRIEAQQRDMIDKLSNSEAPAF